MVSRDEDEAAHADLVDALLTEVVGRVAPVDARRVVSMRFDWGGLRAKSAAYGNFWANSYASEMSSSCSVFSDDDSAFASAMNENGLPVEEKQSLSTAEISAPTASGKLDLTCWSFMLWSTTDCAGEGRG